jgi:hypothetical protein
MSMFQQTELAAKTRLAEGLALKVKINSKSRKVPGGPRGNAQNESNMIGQAMLHLKALMRKLASRCLLLTWRGRKFDLTKMSSYLDVTVLLKNLV